MDRQRLVGVGLVLVSAASFGSGALFAKPVYAAGVDWLTLLAWRFLIGATLSWAWLAISAERRAGLLRLSRRRVLVALGLGVLYLGNSGTLLRRARDGLGVPRRAHRVHLPGDRRGAVAPGRPPARRPAAVGRPGDGAGRDGPRARWHPGGRGAAAERPVAVIASPIIYAVWIVLSARLSGETTERVGGEADDGADTAAATALMMVATAVGFWALAIATRRPVLPAEVPGAAWPGIVGIGLVSTFVAIQTFYEGTKRVGAAQASLISTFEPVWTITLAALLFGETLGPLQLVGGAFVIGGVLLAQTAPSTLGRGSTLRVADE